MAILSSLRLFCILAAQGKISDFSLRSKEGHEKIEDFP